jgi:hypothetical protein
LTQWDTRLWNSTKRGLQYELHCCYTYKVDDKEYTGTVFCVTGIGSGSSYPATDFQAVANKYQSGGTCEVAYDPTDPSDAVLETGKTWLTRSDWTLPLLCGVAAIAMVWIFVAECYRAARLRAQRQQECKDT